MHVIIFILFCSPLYILSLVLHSFIRIIESDSFAFLVLHAFFGYHRLFGSSVASSSNNYTFNCYKILYVSQCNSGT